MGSTELQQYCLECCEKTVQCTTWICFAVRRLHCTAWIHSAVRRLHCTAWICCSTAKISTAVHCSRRSIRPWIIWIFDSCDLASGIAARKPTLITINMLICTHGCPQYRYKLSWVDRRRFWRRIFFDDPSIQPKSVWQWCVDILSKHKCSQNSLCCYILLLL